MITSLLLPSPLQKLSHPLLFTKSVRVFIKREDLIHPELGGNKWRKLKYNIEAYQHGDHTALLTFGGAYSNHIFATAAAGKHYNIPTIGIIRGEEHLPLNPVLQYAIHCGMRLEYMDRTTYRNKDDDGVIEELKEKYGQKTYVLSEGGSNSYAIRGCMEISEEIIAQAQRNNAPLHICVACGTGCTMAGLIHGFYQKNKDRSITVLGFPALKGDFMEREINKWLPQEPLLKAVGSELSWNIISDYHFGGYAKTQPALLSFIKDFYEEHAIQLDRIYTGKMMYGLWDLIVNNYFEKGSVIVALHTGRSSSYG